MKKWFSIQAKESSNGRTVEIRIHDVIGEGGVTSKAFMAEMDAAVRGVPHITLSINSPGGDVFEAFAIYNALRRYKGKITTCVEGIAASAASLIFMTGHTRVMADNAMLMIHNPMADTVGNAEELRKAAEVLDKIRSGAVDIYAQRTGKPNAEIIQMMADTTWFDAYEAQEAGFCDKIDGPVQLRASAGALQALEKLERVPTALLARLRRSTIPQNAAQPAMSLRDKVIYINSICKEHKATNLSDAIIHRGADLDKAELDACIKDALEIDGLCAAAHLPDKAYDFVMTGLSVEAIRARLFEYVVNNGDGVISNLQRPESSEYQTGTAEHDQGATAVYRR